jgi:hypothetical protein
MRASTKMRSKRHDDFRVIAIAGSGELGVQIRLEL